MERKSAMRECKFRELIDDYLLNRLAEDDRNKFEEHYFNCVSCFEEMAERDELLRVIKRKGREIFEEKYIPETAGHISWAEKIAYAFTPRQWVFAAAAAATLLIIVFGVLPYLTTTAPQFYISEDVVRGQSIDLISPVIDTATVPSQFEWKKSEKAVEYTIYIFNNGDVLWTTTTKEEFVILPERVKEMMKMDGKYSWQVKAFSGEGTLIAVSSKVQFKVNRDK
jgi:hypothetical protein